METHTTRVGRSRQTVVGASSCDFAPQSELVKVTASLYWALTCWGVMSGPPGWKFLGPWTSSASFSAVLPSGRTRRVVGSKSKAVYKRSRGQALTFLISTIFSILRLLGRRRTRRSRMSCAELIMS